ncbi:hypothetical protein V8G54_032985 [Vigna mungo]|uniref:Uncharacterized protein n=1 Tax=Vigna mungo TaxID=3915 RepID=A0AAQ3RIF7_VIGMU
MGETKEVQHSPETFFTIHMADPQEVHLSKIVRLVILQLFGQVLPCFPPFGLVTPYCPPFGLVTPYCPPFGSVAPLCLPFGLTLPRFVHSSAFTAFTVNTVRPHFPPTFLFLLITSHLIPYHYHIPSATLLGRLYYEKGGKSKWIGTLVQLGGFPILLPYYFITESKILTSNNSIHPNQPSATMLAFSYRSGYGLWFSLTQLVFKKVIKRETLKVIMDMIRYTFLVGTCAIIVGHFASGEWHGLKNEMKEYETGKASYVLNEPHFHSHILATLYNWLFGGYQ